MKATELMIGDWVYAPKPKRLEPIKIDFLSDKLQIGELKFAGELIEPIPLTEEILKANGFDKKQLDDSFLYSKEVGNYCIVFLSENGCPYLTIEDVEDTGQHHTCVELKDEVYNVHELQHALRLCGLNELADKLKIK